MAWGRKVIKIQICTFFDLIQYIQIELKWIKNELNWIKMNWIKIDRQVTGVVCYCASNAKLFSLYLFLPFHYNNQVVMLLPNSFLSITTNLIPFNARSAVTIRWRSLHGIIHNMNISLSCHNKKSSLYIVCASWIFLLRSRFNLFQMKRSTLKFLYTAQIQFFWN